MAAFFHGATHGGGPGHGAALAAAQAASYTENLRLEDLLATLVELSALGVARAVTLAFADGPVPPVYLSGGGAHNPALVAALQRHLPGVPFATTDTLEVPPDAKEAILFAVLANEAVAGQPVALGAGRQRVPAVRMGKLSWPGVGSAARAVLCYSGSQPVPASNAHMSKK